MNYWIIYFLILFLGGGGLISVSVYVYKTKGSSSPFINILLIILSVFITFMALEFYFKLFFYESDSLGTLAQQNWRERYYKVGFNSLGYRDVEWTEEMIAGKTKVMIVGDSFVAGVGIDYTKDRFSNQLGQKLGNDYALFNLGKSGTNTNHHIEAIVNYPYSPNVLILSYYINDVIGAASPKNWLKKPNLSDPPPLLLPLVKNSYAFNFFYWRSIRIVQSDQLQGEWHWLLTMYNDPVDWWVHQQQLLAIYEGTQSEQIPLIVVVFPSLTDIKATGVISERIINWFEEKGVTVINVADMVQDMPVKERVVSSIDAHASVKLNSLIAEELYNIFIEQGIAKEQN